MRGHLELLTPLAADSSDSTGDPDATAEAAALSDPEHPTKAVAATHSSGSGGFEHGELELLELDEEIASISAQLEQARQEMASMMKAKQDLEREVGCVSEQMSAEVDAGELPTSDE
jgi:hypothetical protein